jgi:phage/plasmid primase, P4 family, C-terminal domain
MLSSLESLIKENNCLGKENFLSLDPITKKFYLPKTVWKTIDSFYKNDDVESVSLLEIPQEEYSILRFDIDIYPTDSTKGLKKLYNEDTIVDVVKRVHYLINSLQYENIGHANNFICCVFEKENWKIKDGFHLIFPHLFVKHEFQDGFFVRELQEYLKDKSVSVDKVSKKPWVVLGFRKKTDSDLYKLTEVYDKNLTASPPSKFLPSSFSVNQKSIIVYGKTFRQPILKKERLPKDIKSDYDSIVQWGLLDKLSITRSENYDSWIEIGIALYNIGCGEESFLELWKEFSNKCPNKFDSSVCDKKWRSFRARNITIRSLFYYFKQDDPKSFDQMVYLQNINKVYQDLFPSDQIADQLKSNCVFENCHIAKIFYNKYCNDFIWAPSKGKGGSWYTFDGHKWILLPEEILREKINGEFSRYIDDLFDQIRLDKSTEDEDGKISKYLYLNQKKLDNKLNNINFIKNVIEASKSYFINQNFQKHLDANKFLIGCENGVLDFDREIFRYSSPDDFLSMSTGIYYEEPTDEEIHELNCYLEDLFVDQKLIDNVLEIIASSLIGNDDKNIIVALGPTNAGKTGLVNLLEKTLGDYAVTFPKELVYQRAISSSSARPELARVEGKRIAFINELSKDERMNVATVKELSGKDKVYARRLYSEGNEIIPMFTLYLSCNEVPRIPQDDEALWGRLLIIGFESSFINEASENRAIQLKERKFPRISNLGEKFFKMAPTLLWVLFDTYINNKRNYSKGIPICKSISESTKSFRESNNPVFRFIQERITIDEQEGKFFKCGLLFDLYAVWYKSYFPDKKVRINKEQFKQSFIKHSGLPLVKEKIEDHTRKIEGWNHITFGDKE